MTVWLSALPPPIGSVVLTLITLAVSYGAGHVIRLVAFSRLSALARRTRGQWDDVVVEEMSPRVPFWGLLLGAEVSTGFWTFPPHLAEGIFPMRTLIVRQAESAASLERGLRLS